MSSEWPTVTIADVCELIIDCVNKTAPVVEEPTPYRMIRTTNIRNGRIDLSECRFVDETTYAKWTRRAELRFGDVLLTREAPIGEVGFVLEPKGLFLGQRVMQYRANAKVLSPRFLLYSFLSPALQRQFGSHEGSGSVVSHIRVGDCFKFKLKLPPLPVQHEIAALLGALDDRIALLRETNATLEAIAQALFKSWFVDFDPVRAKQQGIAPAGMDEATTALFPDSFEESALGLVPTGWRPGTVSDFAQMHRGSVNPGANGDTMFEHFSLPAFDAGQMPVRELGAAIKSNKTSVPRDAVLLSKLNPHIPRAWLPVDAGPHAVCSTEFLVFVPAPGASREFAYCSFVAAPFQERLRQLVTGTSNSHQRVKPDGVATLSAVVPSGQALDAFTSVVRPTFERIGGNRLQAQTLATLRDTLLPRLISGQIRLAPAQEAIAEATHAD
jgi:type I restriction enzyme S subunit